MTIEEAIEKIKEQVKERMNKLNWNFTSDEIQETFDGESQSNNYPKCARWEFDYILIGERLRGISGIKNEDGSEYQISQSLEKLINEEPSLLETSTGETIFKQWLKKLAFETDKECIVSNKEPKSNKWQILIRIIVGTGFGALSLLIGFLFFHDNADHWYNIVETVKDIAGSVAAGGVVGIIQSNKNREATLSKGAGICGGIVVIFCFVLMVLWLLLVWFGYVRWSSYMHVWIGITLALFSLVGIIVVWLLRNIADDKKQPSIVRE